jgi:hypothetical protein
MIIRRILRGLAFWIILVFLVVLGIRFVPLNGDYSYHKVLLKTKDSLLKSAFSPKIILVGGSNVGLGVDSELLQYETGYNVVNLGTSGGYRYKTYFKLIEDTNLDPSDIVVVLPEYIDYHNDLVYLYRFVSLYTEVIKYFDFPEDYSVGPFAQWLSTLGVKYLDTTPVVESSLRENFNKYGDSISHYRLWVKGNVICDSDLNRTNFSYALALLNQFNELMSKKGVKVLFGPPVFFKDCYTGEQKDVISEFYDFMKADAKFPVIGSPERYLFERSLIFDTLYHVNFYGKKIRTEKLIEDIKPFLDKNILSKQLLFKDKVDFQKVLMEVNVPSVMHVNEKFLAKIKITNKGFANLNYWQGYFVKNFDHGDVNSINFGLGGNAGAYQSYGWSDPENMFTWTNGKEAGLEVPLAGVTEDVLMEADLNGVFVLKKGDSQLINIYVDDHFVGSWDVFSSGTYKIKIPKQYIVNSKVVLRFELPNAMSAAGSGDRRVLAVCFRQIKFDFSLKTTGKMLPKIPQVNTLEFDKNVDLNTGDSYEFDLPVVALQKPGVYRMKFEFHQMDNIVPGGVLYKQIKVIK